MEETGLVRAGKRKTMTKVDIVENIYEKVEFPRTEVAKIVGFRPRLAFLFRVTNLPNPETTILSSR